MAIGHGLYKYITTEHILGLYLLVYSIGFPTQTQYIERRMTQELMGTSSVVRSNSLCAVNKTSPEYHLMEQVQQKTSMWMLYITGSTAFFALVSINSWGSLSDKYGRYIAFAVPGVGLMAANVLNVLVIRFELSLWLMVVANSIQGVFGDLTLFVVGCAGYISDVTVKGSFERTVRYVLIDTIGISASGICQLATGYLIKGFGFEAPYLSSFGVMAVCALLIVFSVPDRRITPPEHSNQQAPPNTLNIFKNINQLFRQNKFRGWLLAGYVLIIALFMMVLSSLPGIVVLYTTGEPFCMDPVQEGYFLAAFLALQSAGTVIGGTILTKYISKFWILHIASAFAMVFYIVTAFAKDYTMLYAGLVGALFLFVCVPLSRVSIANLTGAHEQGVMFAFTGCVQGIFGFISPLTVNPIYASSLSFMNGFVFLVFATVAVISWIIILLLHIFESKWTKNKVLEQEGQIQSDDSYEKV